jgi:HSP20 family molecular chaperone IbpA
MTPSRPPFASFGQSIVEGIMEQVGRAAGRVQEESPLPADVLESDEEYLVVFDAPGVTASDVQIQLEGTTLEVRIDRFRTFRENFDMRFPGRGLELDGRIELPEDVDRSGEGARAELEDDGTLYVYVPKATAEDEPEE